MKKRVIIAVLGLIVTVVTVTLFIYQIKDHTEALLKAMREADYRLILLATLCNYVFFFVVRSYRWQLFLKPMKKDLPYGLVFRATNIGFMANMLLPLRVGEVIRPYMVHRQARVPFGTALASAFGLERPFDMIGIILLLLITWPSLPTTDQMQPGATGGQGQALVQEAQPEAGGQNAEVRPDDHKQETQRRVRRLLTHIRGYGWVAMGMVMLGVLLLFLIGLYPDRFAGLVARTVWFLPDVYQDKLETFVQSIAAPMQFMRKPVRVTLAFIASAICWGGVGLSHWILARAFGLDVPLVAGFLTTVTIAFAVALPQAPGYLGAFNTAALVSVSVFGADTGKAGAFAIMIWIISFVPVVVVGLFSLWHEGLSLRGLARQAQEKSEEAPPVAVEPDRGEESGPQA